MFVLFSLQGLISVCLSEGLAKLHMVRRFAKEAIITLSMIIRLAQRNKYMYNQPTKGVKIKVRQKIIHVSVFVYEV